MTRLHHYVFVLWGEGFDETPATLFISKLRRAGLSVKVVGLNMQRLTGAHGLPLLPDMTLERALAQAHLVSCVILPCQAKYLLQFSYDPRIAEFFQRLQGNSPLIVGEIGMQASKPLNAMFPADVRVLEYAMDDDVVTISQAIQEALASCG